MNSRDSKIVWIDVETSGVDSETDHLLEIGMIITDMKGAMVSENAVYDSLIHVDDLGSVMSSVSPIVHSMHEKSGLWHDLWREQGKPSYLAEQELNELLTEYVEEDDVLYFGGNSVTLDRNFVRASMPSFYRRISHFSIDVTSIGALLKGNGVVSGFYKNSPHRALPDIYESLSEYIHYCQAINDLMYTN